MSEFKIYNNRPIIRTIFILFTVLLEIIWLFAFVIGQIQTNSDIVFAVSIIIGTIILMFILYLTTEIVFRSEFVFNENGVIRYIRRKEKLKIDWDKIISIGHYAIIDLFNYSIGPGIMEIDYFDEKGSQRKISVAFPVKAARELKNLGIHPKLNNFVSDN